ncbi:MAG: outer membrane lipoprotein-sorting protein [Halieaceae bacterium]|jgi:outer membrane lipoprotein-sorting protein|nr:outer membrane lipoprotein-sorting protein [Halieaceae bacterium]
MFRITSVITLIVLSWQTVAQPEPRELIEKAMDHWRGLTSYTEMTLIIHRPKWERSMSMQSWTQGAEQSLVRVTAPVKDAGNGTLLKDKNMWTYAPKINRVIKIPSSMMNQSWMGSDLSNNDISKSTDIIDQYDHTLLETKEVEGHTVYVIQSIPHEDAAVVWGKEIHSIRDDYVMLEEQFWDQDGVLVKTFSASDIKEFDGRSVAAIMRMQEVDKPGQWTEMRVDDTHFDIDLPANLFTLSSLRNPRR